MKKRLALSALMLSLALPSATALAGGMEGMPMGPVSTAQVSNDSDVLFMEVMTMSNLTEITTSQLALKKSSNAEVRAFAQTMINHHTKAQAELEALAAKKGCAWPTSREPISACSTTSSAPCPAPPSTRCTRRCRCRATP